MSTLGGLTSYYNLIVFCDLIISECEEDFILLLGDVNCIFIIRTLRISKFEMEYVYYLVSNPY